MTLETKVKVKYVIGSQLEERKRRDRSVYRSRLKGGIVVSLSKALYPLLGTGPTQKDRKSSQNN